MKKIQNLLPTPLVPFCYREFDSEFCQETFIALRDEYVFKILTQLREGPKCPDDLVWATGLDVCDPRGDHSEAYSEALSDLERNHLVHWNPSSNRWRLMVEVTDTGAILMRSFHMSRSRYHYDGSLGKGWVQYDTDQDFSHFGIWVNAEERVIVTFAEGDQDIAVCLTLDIFKAQLAAMADFYGAPPPSAIVIREDGTIEEFYSERPS